MIKTTEIIVQLDNPFENCKLHREQYADILTTVIDSYKEGFVMAINNKWGEGKTTFVKMWEQKLKNDGYETLYFNAWENDFEDNPLTAIMGELKSLSNDTTKEDFKELLVKGSIIAKNVLPIIAKGVLKRYIDSDELGELVKASAQGMTQMFEEDVKEYAKKKESIKEFKDKLQNFISKTTNDKPLIFVIDELDRCRPNYAVSVLEKVKHFFSVPGIVFILSIDKEQLGNAIKGVYGNDNIDADEYLRRFIDLEYSLPEPNVNKYCDYLYDYYNFDSFFKSNERRGYRDIGRDGEYFLKLIKLFFSNKKFPLRQQQKIFSHARIALRMFRNNDYVLPSVFIFLILLRDSKQNIYNKIKTKNITLNEIQDELINMFSPTNRKSIFLAPIEADIIFLSNHYLYGSQDKLIYVNQQNETTLKITSKVEDDCKTFFKVFEQYNYDLPFGLDYLITKIELTENFKEID